MLLYLLHYVATLRQYSRDLSQLQFAFVLRPVRVPLLNLLENITQNTSNVEPDILRCKLPFEAKS
jgi:hypothetical protein